jgi:hypothetical protein
MRCDGVAEWVSPVWQTHTPSSGDEHHTWSCGNNVVAHCLYTGIHVVTENSRDKHILVFIGSLGKQEHFTFLAVKQWRQKAAQKPQMEGRTWMNILWRACAGLKLQNTLPVWLFRGSSMSNSLFLVTCNEWKAYTSKDRVLLGALATVCWYPYFVTLAVLSCSRTYLWWHHELPQSILRGT